jgi:hypothetical protein
MPNPALMSPRCALRSGSTPSFVLSVLVLLTLAAPPAFAACEVGNRPGSTVLFPYFEVDLADPTGLTTLISLTAESNMATLTRVVLWTDWAIPVLAFDVYLRPRDVQTMNLRDVLNGSLPSTGAGANLSAFPGCQTSPPTYANPALSATSAQQLRAYLTGVRGPLDALCAGEAFGDNAARGYITVDNVTSCSGLSMGLGGSIPTATPRSPSYFTQLAINHNAILWGDVLYVDSGENSAQGLEAVAIQSLSSPAGPDTNTFYGRYHSFDGRDRRAPLPTSFSTRYLEGGIFDGGTDLIVFRDNGTNSVTKVSCGSHPSWYPLPADSFYAHDEDGLLVRSQLTNYHFPLATQRVPVASLGLPPSAPFGLLGLVLSNRAPRGAWVESVMSASGRFSAGLNAIPQNTGCGLRP